MQFDQSANKKNFVKNLTFSNKKITIYSEGENCFSYSFFYETI